MAAVNGVPCGWQVNFKNGDTMKEPKHPLLVADKARHVGDAIAIVIAESQEQAVDAAEAVNVEYEELPCVVDASKAARPVHHWCMMMFPIIFVMTGHWAIPLQK